jgi:hypothetical protein
MAMGWPNEYVPALNLAGRNGKKRQQALFSFCCEQALAHLPLIPKSSTSN